MIDSSIAPMVKRMVILLMVAVGLFMASLSSATVAVTASSTTAATVSVSLTPTLTPTPIATVTDNSQWTPQTLTINGLTMVLTPPGCFMMGSTDAQVQDVYTETKKSDPTITLDAFKPEQPAHNVCITKGFWMNQDDVTNAAYDVFIKAGGYRNDAYWSADGLKWKQSKSITGPGLKDDTQIDCSWSSSEPQQPRVCISWYEAQAYANWFTQTAQDGLVFRLPTEAEWEYAARGPQALVYPWGNTFDPKLVNYCDINCTEVWKDKSANDGYKYTSPVGHYKDAQSWVNANDMAGNIWQWMADWYDATYYQTSPTNDPIGSDSGTYRVVRGGSFLSTPHNTRAAGRSYTHFPSDGRRIYIGFRLVASIQ